jgi:tetratricopeptide (TPR) repeat protein
VRLNFPRLGGRRDHRLVALVLVAISITSLGYLASRLPGKGIDNSIVRPQEKHGEIKPDLHPFAGIPDSAAQVEREEFSGPTTSATSSVDQQKQTLRKEARKLLADKKFKAAIRPLEALIQLTPESAQPHLLMGLALEGAGNFELARKYYEAAVDRDPMMADAYFGYATTSDALNDLESALGGMRSFLHVQKDDDPYRMRVAQARSAIWEWESRLGRGPWGPTKGIPPGFTEAELKRDGRGVGTKMPIPGTEQADGSMQYEIKHSDKIKMYKK